MSMMTHIGAAIIGAVIGVWCMCLFIAGRDRAKLMDLLRELQDSERDN